MTTASREPGPAAGSSPEPAEGRVYRTVLAVQQRPELERRLRETWAAAGFDLRGEKLKARVVHVHFRPGVRGRVLVRVKITRKNCARKPLATHVFLQVHRSSEGARRRFEGITSRPLPGIGPPCFLIEDWGVVGWTLPNGPLLRHAKIFYSRKKTQRFLAGIGIETGPGRAAGRRPKLLRYVPRKRALFRLEPPGHGVLFVKLFAHGEDEPAAANLRLLADAGFGGGGELDTPRLVAHVPERRTIVMANVPGRQLSELVERDDPELFRSVGRALASLHDSGLRPAAEWTPARESSRLGLAARDLGKALPALVPRLDELVGHLRGCEGSAAFVSGRPIHGNLFGDQLLVTEGGRVGLVDWDDFSLGDPLFDVGRLIAHLAFLLLQGEEGREASDRRAAWLLEGHGAPLPGPRLEALRWLVAASLIIRAKISALRPLAPQWPSLVAGSLDLAEDVLAGRAFPSLGGSSTSARPSADQVPTP